jgi:PAS domain S-box-containing protein
VVADGAEAHGDRDGAGDGIGAPTAPDSARGQTRALVREIARRTEVEAALRTSLRQLRRKEEQLRLGTEELADFLENATFGVHRLGPDGRILWANRAELELLGYGTDEYVGHRVAEFHFDEQAIADILKRLKRGESLRDVAVHLRAKDGSIKHVLLSCSGYFRDGELVHSRCFTRDITHGR